MPAEPLKVMVFGNSGAGKTTLAKQLQCTHQLAHLDLDTLAWQTTQPTQRAPLSDSLQAIERFMAQHTAWVIEGCYADLLRLVSPHANSATFMNLSIAACQDNARRRPWEPHKYSSQAAQDANLSMLLDWIADYPNRTDEFSYQAHQALYDDFEGDKQVFEHNHLKDISSQHHHEKQN